MSESVAAWKVHHQQCWSPRFESFQTLILSRATVTMKCYSSIYIIGFHSLWPHSTLGALHQCTTNKM